MALKKITDAEMDQQGVCAAPDVLDGTPSQNKALFDRMVRQLVAPAVNTLVDAVETAEENQEKWSAEEQKRVAAESGRTAAESKRVTAENDRITAEQSRVEAEQLRSDAEELRASAEQTRITNETARRAAESERSTAEAQRIAAEQNRLTAEQNRVTAEQARAAAEAQRDAAEMDRQGKSTAMQVWEEYESSKAYVPLNKVEWNGSSYICVKPCTGVLPENGNYWLMIAKKGTDGATVSANGMYGFSVEDGHLILYYSGDTPPDFSIDENGHLILRFDESHIMDIGAVIGPKGDVGPGVPTGGTAGQVLTKIGDSDYAAEWKDVPADGNVGLDATLTVEGKAADAKAVGDALSTLSEEIANKTSGAGLNSTVKSLLITILRNAYYNTNFDANAYITNLETALNSSDTGDAEIYYNILFNLGDGLSSANSSTTITGGSTYNTTIISDEGYIVDAVTVTMGGVDVTSTVYSNNVINIENVAGDIVITATSKEIPTVVNLFDVSTITEGKYAYITSGELSANTNRGVSDYIAVSAGKSYKITTYVDVTYTSGADSYCVYDTEKVYNTYGTYSKDTSVTPTELTATYSAETDGYIRVNFLLAYKDQTTVVEV